MQEDYSSLPPAEHLKPSLPTLPSAASPTSTVPALLARAISLSSSLPPLYTWRDLCTIIHTCDLGALDRHPALERLYRDEFGEAVRAEFGDMQTFLLERLAWGEQSREEELWERRMEVRVRRNDWQYAVPREVEHWVIWTPLPVFARSLCRDDEEWEKVSQVGLAGFSGFASADEVVGFGGGVDGPGRELDAFVKERWKEDEYEVAWFANPPSLQSVPGIAHFHALVKEKGRVVEA